MENTILGSVSVMRRIVLILALVLALAPAPAFADFITVLVGPQTVGFGSDVGDYYDVPSGIGIGFLVGLELPFPLDLRFGRRTTTEGSNGLDGSDVIYEWLEVGTRFRLGTPGETTKGDWFVGLGAYDIELRGLEFDTAPGAFIGMGVEQTVSDSFVGRFEVKGVYWKSETFQTEATTLNVSLLFGFTF
jgi:hypothetical protein